MSPADRRALPAVLFCGAFAVVTAWAFHPGMLSRDSVEQLSEAVSGRFTDWHPPLMAALWALLLRLPGVSMAAAAPLLFLLQLVAYWGSFALVARALARRSATGWAPWLAPLAALTPACLTYTVNVWKDVGLAVSWLAAALLALEAREAGRTRPGARRTVATLSLVLLFYGVGVRRNAFFGLPPLALLWWSSFVSRRRRWRGAAAVCVCLVASTQLVERTLLRAAAKGQAQVYLLGELTAMRCADGGDGAVSFPVVSWKGAPDADRLCRVTWDRIHRRHNHDHTVYGAEAPFVVVPEPDVTAALSRELRGAVVRHPLRWVRHRLHMFAGVLDGRVVVRFHGVRDNVLGLGYRPSAWTRAQGDWVGLFGRSWLFTGWLWALLAAFVLWRMRRVPFGTPQALAASGLCYLAGYALVSIAPDSRYVYWPVLSTTAGLLVGPVRERMRGRPSATRIALRGAFAAIRRSR